jgi:hypothetical protein
MRMLLKGVEKHLHSPIDKVRILGMVVGENLMNELNRYGNLNEKTDNKKLKFEVFFMFFCEFNIFAIV